MINVIVAYDNQVQNLGTYFNACKNDIEGFFNEQSNVNAFYYDSKYCNQVYIDTIALPQIIAKPFIFIGYSHGIESALLENEINPYIKKGVNSHLFYNSLFISNACLVGEQLGKDLIDNSALGFIGFDVKANILFGYEQHFIRIDNYFVKYFIRTNVSIKEGLRTLIDEYTLQIDRFSELYMIDILMEFEKQKDSLINLYHKLPENLITKNSFDV